MPSEIAMNIVKHMEFLFRNSAIKNNRKLIIKTSIKMK